MFSGTCNCFFLLIFQQRRQERASRVLAEIRKVEEQIVTSPERFDVEIREHENRVSGTRDKVMPQGDRGRVGCVLH